MRTVATTRVPAAPGAGLTTVPVAGTVFRDKGYITPEELIAQF